MDNLFIVGDLYGYRGKAEELLKNWNPDHEKLIFLGNVMGKGEDSCGLLAYITKLSTEYGAVLLSGRNEYQFIKWISEPLVNTSTYYGRSGREVINSFFDDNVTNQFAPENIAQDIVFTYYREVNFMQNLPLYVEGKNHLCVPASVRLDGNWINSTEVDFRMGNEFFHSRVNKTNKTILFGTIPTSLLNQDKTNNAWLSPCKTKIGLNGNSEKGGYCHAVKIIGSDRSFFAS